MARIEQDEIGELLSAYIDGELSTSQRMVVEKLLREDATARHLLEQLRRTVDATQALPRHPAPASLAGDVQAMLERTALLDDAPHAPIRLHRDRAPWAARLSIAAMVGLVAVGGWYYLQEPAKNRPTSSPMSLPGERSVESAGADSAAREAERPRIGDSVALADRRTVDEKLAAGVELASLRTHPFEAEGLRLQVNVKDTKDAAALVDRVSKRLADEKLINLETKPGASASASAGFYLRGSEGRNFIAPQESQILVRATPAQLEQVLSDVAIAKPSEGDATLVAGTLKVQGIQQSQQVLNATRRSRTQAAAPTSPPTDKLAAGVKKEAPSDDFVTNLVKIVGIDPALLQKSEDKGGATSVASAEKAEEKDAESNAPTDEAGARREATHAEPTGTLVDRSLARIAEPAPAALEPEPLVTLIIQMVPPPEPARPAKPTTPKSTTREKSGRSS
jgi:hypothetical protein